MRFIEAVLLSPFFTLAVALVSLVVAPKLNARAETVLLVFSGVLIGISVFRTPPISAQDLLPRILITCALTAMAGIVLCLIGGWRPILGPKPPGFAALANNVEYPSGTKLGGIPWSSRFGDTRLILFSTEDYKDLDITIKSDVPIAAVGQITDLDARFVPVANASISQQLIKSDTKKQYANPLVLVATSGGYRIQCPSLPHDEKLEIVIATADIVDFPPAGAPPRGTIFDRDYVLKMDFTDKNTNETTANWYGHGNDKGGRRIEEIYKTARRLPTTINIEGSTGSGDEKRVIKQTIKVEDLVSQFIKHHMPN